MASHTAINYKALTCFASFQFYMRLAVQNLFVSPKVHALNFRLKLRLTNTDIAII